MLLVLDVGNTNIVMGFYKGNELLVSFRISTDKVGTADEIGLLLLQIFKIHNISVQDIEGVIVSSVVPTIMYSLEHAIKKYLNAQPLVVGRGIKTGINIQYDNPKEVGADRIVNAVAAHNIYKCPIIVVDFGTATTFCAVSAKGEYLGGVICPGIKIANDALFQKTSKLPRIEIAKPRKVIGKNTIESMQSGIYYGYAGQVDYIIDKMRTEMLAGKNPRVSNMKVIATGGLARMISDQSEFIKEIHPTLTLEGLRIIYYMNRPQRDSNA